MKRYEAGLCEIFEEIDTSRQQCSMQYIVYAVMIVACVRCATMSPDVIDPSTGNEI